MSLLKFELKKIWRQKRLVWLLVVVFLGVWGVFHQNFSNREAMKDRLMNTTQLYVEESDGLYPFFNDFVGIW